MKFILEKKKYFAIGLMSGTSMDGVDASLISIEHKKDIPKIKLVEWDTLLYPPKFKARLVKSSYSTTRDICELNFIVGDFFAKAAILVSKKAKLSLDKIDFIGSHGQAIFHIKDEEGRSSTLQIGESAIIAEKTGVMVVNDFRPRDIAVHGLGAPLIPMVDYILFHDQKFSVLTLNIGGTANITYLPSDTKKILGFDTGPGNSLIDAAFRLVSYKNYKYDKDGEVSKRGKINENLLNYLLKDSYFKKSPPKMIGFEYRDRFVKKIKTKFPDIKFEDLIATFVELTSITIARAIFKFIIPIDSNVKLVYASGGGVHNKTLINSLKFHLKSICKINNFIIDTKYGDAKEAMGFAILAYLTLMNQPANVKSVTGAKYERVLGKITPY